MLRKNILAKRHSAQRRAIRTRAKIHGTASRPRLSVFRSDKHISAQIINDDLGQTICAVSDMKMPKTEKPMVRAAHVGETLAKAAVAAGVQSVIFDRGAYLYHGRVAALAQACRDNGLQF